MTKEDKIKEAYFKLFEEKSLIEKEKRFDAIKSFIDSYGWLSGSLFGVDKKLLDFSGHEELPKSLQGIENNNGWIKIESEDDLPKFTIEYYVLKNGSLTTAYYRGNNRWIIPENDYPKTTEIHKITHYQPIEKPKPPIY